MELDIDKYKNGFQMPSGINSLAGLKGLSESLKTLWENEQRLKYDDFDNATEEEKEILFNKLIFKNTFGEDAYKATKELGWTDDLRNEYLKESVMRKYAQDTWGNLPEYSKIASLDAEGLYQLSKSDFGKLETRVDAAEGDDRGFLKSAGNYISKAFDLVGSAAKDFITSSFGGNALNQVLYNDLTLDGKVKMLDAFDNFKNHVGLTDEQINKEAYKYWQDKKRQNFNFSFDDAYKEYLNSIGFNRDSYVTKDDTEITTLERFKNITGANPKDTRNVERDTAILDEISRESVNRYLNTDDVKNLKQQYTEVLNNAIQTELLKISELDDMVELILSGDKKKVSKEESLTGNEYEIATGPEVQLYKGWKDTNAHKRMSLDLKIDIVALYESLKNANYAVQSQALNDLYLHIIHNNTHPYEILAKSQLSFATLGVGAAAGGIIALGVEGYELARYGDDPRALRDNMLSNYILLYLLGVSDYNTFIPQELNKIRENGGVSPYILVNEPGDDSLWSVSGYQNGSGMGGMIAGSIVGAKGIGTILKKVPPVHLAKIQSAVSAGNVGGAYSLGIMLEVQQELNLKIDDIVNDRLNSAFNSFMELDGAKFLQNYVNENIGEMKPFNTESPEYLQYLQKQAYLELVGRQLLKDEYMNSNLGKSVRESIENSEDILAMRDLAVRSSLQGAIAGGVLDGIKNYGLFKTIGKSVMLPKSTRDALLSEGTIRRVDGKLKGYVNTAIGEIEATPWKMGAYNLANTTFFGGMDNYTDEICSRFGKGFGLSSYRLNTIGDYDYASHKFNPNSYAIINSGLALSTAHMIADGLNEGFNKLGSDRSVDAFNMGILGMFTPGLITVVNSAKSPLSGIRYTDSTGKSYRGHDLSNESGLMRTFKTLDNWVYNPLWSEFARAENPNLQGTLANKIKLLNQFNDENKNSVDQLVPLLSSFLQVETSKQEMTKDGKPLGESLDIREFKDAKIQQLLNLIVAVKELEDPNIHIEDSEFLGNIFKNILLGNFEDSEVRTMVDNYMDHNDISSENRQYAESELRDKVDDLMKLQETYELNFNNVKLNPNYFNLSRTAQHQIAYLLTIKSNLSDRIETIKKLTESVLSNLKSSGKYTGKNFYKFESEAERDAHVKTIQSNIDLLLKELLQSAKELNDITGELLLKGITPSEINSADNEESLKLKLKYHSALSAYLSIRELLNDIEELKESTATEEIGTNNFNSVQELLHNLNFDSLLYLIENKEAINPKMKKLVDKVIKRLDLQDSNLVQAIRDAKIMQTRIESIDRNNYLTQNHPELLNSYIIYRELMYQLLAPKFTINYAAHLLLAYLAGRLDTAFRKKNTSTSELVSLARQMLLFHPEMLASMYNNYALYLDPKTLKVLQNIKQYDDMFLLLVEGIKDFKPRYKQKLIDSVIKPIFMEGSLVLDTESTYDEMKNKIQSLMYEKAIAEDDVDLVNCMSTLFDRVDNYKEAYDKAIKDSEQLIDLESLLEEILRQLEEEYNKENTQSDSGLLNNIENNISATNNIQADDSHQPEVKDPIPVQNTDSGEAPIPNTDNVLLDSDIESPIPQAASELFNNDAGDVVILKASLEDDYIGESLIPVIQQEDDGSLPDYIENHLYDSTTLVTEETWDETEQSKIESLPNVTSENVANVNNENLILSPSDSEDQLPNEMLGTALYEYDIDELSSSTSKKITRRKDAKIPINKFYAWLDSRGIKYQEIIDEELPLILENNPDVKIYIGALRDFELTDLNGIGKPLDLALSHVMLFIEYTDDVAAIHDDSRGGVIEYTNFNGEKKKFLVVGTYGFPTKIEGQDSDYEKRLSNWKSTIGRVKYASNAVLNSEGKNYWQQHQSDPLSDVFIWYHRTAPYTQVKEMSSGRVAKLLQTDTEPKERTIQELLNDKSRNPRGLEVDDLKFGVTMYTLFKNNAESDSVVYAPNLGNNAGQIFLLVPTGPKAYNCISLKNVKYALMNKDSLYGKLILSTIDKLASDNFNDRLEAKLALRDLFVLNENSFDINVGDSNINVVDFKFGNRESSNTIQVNLNLENALKLILQIFDENANLIRMNIKASNLLSGMGVLYYLDAGLLVTDAASLSFVNKSYSVYPIVKDLPYKAEERIPTTGVYISNNYKERQTVYLLGNTYRKNSTTLWVDYNDSVVTNPVIIKSLDFALTIQQRNTLPTSTNINPFGKTILYYVITEGDENIVVARDSNGIFTESKDANINNNILQLYNQHQDLLIKLLAIELLLQELLNEKEALQSTSQSTTSQTTEDIISDDEMLAMMQGIFEDTTSTSNTLQDSNRSIELETASEDVNQQQSNTQPSNKTINKFDLNKKSFTFAELNSTLKNRKLILDIFKENGLDTTNKEKTLADLGIDTNNIESIEDLDRIIKCHKK